MNENKNKNDLSYPSDIILKSSVRISGSVPEIKKLYICKLYLKDVHLHVPKYTRVYDCRYIHTYVNKYMHVRTLLINHFMYFFILHRN